MGPPTCHDISAARSERPPATYAHHQDAASAAQTPDLTRILLSVTPDLESGLPQGLIHHSDRGSQYASIEYQQALASRGIQCSMSRKGNCWDNAVVESFFSSLKMELVYPSDFATRHQARSALFEYIEVFYNRQRRHSSLGYLSPVEYERAALRGTLAA